MNNTIERQHATAILTGVRDNLLKPMAEEIEKLQKEHQAAIMKSFEEQTNILSEQIVALQEELTAVMEQQKSLNEQLIVAAAGVKWNE